MPVYFVKDINNPFAESVFKIDHEDPLHGDCLPEFLIDGTYGEKVAGRAFQLQKEAHATGEFKDYLAYLSGLLAFNSCFRKQLRQYIGTVEATFDFPF